MGNPSNITFNVPVACYDGKFRTAYPQGDYPLPAPAGLSTPAVSSTTITAQLSSLPAWVQNVEWSIKRTSDSVWTVAGHQRTVSFTFTELDPDTAYQLRARFQYLAFYSGYSPVAAATTDTTGLPVAPTITGPTRINATKLQIGISGGSGASSWTAQYRTPAGSGSFIDAGPVTVGSTSYDFTVTSGAHYDFRVVATNSAGSVFSNMVSGSTDTESVLFFDDFERTTLLGQPPQNGINWSDSQVIDQAFARTGTCSVRLRFGPDAPGYDSSAELNMRNNAIALTEYCVRYWLFLPENFYHREQGGSLGDTNNKGILQSWSGAYNATNSNQFIGFEYWAVGDGSSILSMRSGRDGLDLEHDFVGDGTGSGNMFRLSERGKWMQLKVHVKLASGPGTSDGNIAAWKWVDGEASPELLYRKTDWGYSTRGNFINSFYYLGWSNSGFADQTDFHIDRFALADQLLDWENF